MISGLLFLFALVAVFAFVAAYHLDSRRGKIWWKRQAVVAALVGGNFPMLLLGIAFALSGDPRTRTIGIYFVLAGFGLLLSALIGYPTAYLFLRRCNRSREGDVFK
ncbi:MAG: hypothetical protein JSR28_08230 [Proteobacteria bacterium]|nr:hypothetical protein [Pseudomonadota bacterium]